MHRKWFDLSDESFAAIHSRVLAYFKLLWIVFNLTPYLALRLFVQPGVRTARPSGRSALASRSNSAVCGSSTHSAATADESQNLNGPR